MNWGEKWYLKKYGKSIPVTEEDIRDEIDKQEEQERYDEKRHRNSLIQSMSQEVADGHV
jgi:hypothetical protein